MCQCFAASTSKFVAVHIASGGLGSETQDLYWFMKRTLCLVHVEHEGSSFAIWVTSGRWKSECYWSRFLGVPECPDPTVVPNLNFKKLLEALTPTDHLLGPWHEPLLVTRELYGSQAYVDLDLKSLFFGLSYNGWPHRPGGYQLTLALDQQRPKPC